MPGILLLVQKLDRKDQCPATKGCSTNRCDKFQSSLAAAAFVGALYGFNCESGPLVTSTGLFWCTLMERQNAYG